MSEAKPKIRVTGLRKSFGGREVLAGMDLTVASGQSMVLFGASATGKTLLLKCILGLVTPDSGHIEIDGKDSSRLSPRERTAYMDRFSMLFQRSGLFDSLPIWENIAFKLLNHRGVERGRARDVAVEKLESVGLSAATADLYPAELSGGMQKRVGIARAIATEPEIVFFDEPTAGLDPIMSNRINDLIVEGLQRSKATAVSITSDMVSARRISQQMTMIHDGKAVWSGPTTDLDRTNNAYVAQFVNKRAEGPIHMRLRDD